MLSRAETMDTLVRLRCHDGSTILNIAFYSAHFYGAINPFDII